jgi:hypothetical protein
MFAIVWAFLEGALVWLVAPRDDGRIGWARVAFLVFLVALGVMSVITAA